nr:esterase-like activity of phytase family protein [Acuticoccus kalidii]
MSLIGPRKFGGFSGLLVDGDRMLAVSDTGMWLSARLILDGERLTGIEDAALWPRLDLLGRDIRTKATGDAEDLARVDGGILVVIEQARELWRYPADGLTIDRTARPERLGRPEQFTRLAKRHGVESLTELPTGERLIVMEGEGTRGAIPALRDETSFAIARSDKWAITGADVLPGGDVLLIERYYGGGIDVRMRVRRLGRDAILGAGPDDVIDGPVLIEADFSDEIDNMEAIAAEVRDGRIILTLMSDDNMSFLQRTLLLRFAVRDPLPRANPLRAPSRA